MIKKAKERKQKLDESYFLHRFLADFRDLTSWINDMKAVICADELAKVCFDFTRNFFFLKYVPIFFWFHIKIQCYNQLFVLYLCRMLMEPKPFWKDIPNIDPKLMPEKTHFWLLQMQVKNYWTVVIMLLTMLKKNWWFWQKKKHHFCLCGRNVVSFMNNVWIFNCFTEILNRYNVLFSRIF